MGPRNHVSSKRVQVHTREGAILTGGTGRPSIKYGDTLRSSVQKRIMNRSRCRLGCIGWDGPMESCVRWGPDPSWVGALLWKETPNVKYRDFNAVSSAKTAEPIDLLFGLRTRVGLTKHKFNRIRYVASMDPRGRAHWRHLANTIELSVASACGDAALFKITLTTCCNFYYFSIISMPA